MRTLALTGVLVSSLALAGCKDDSTPPETDRVVGIDLKCDILYGESGELRLDTLSGWDTCAGWRTPSAGQNYTKTNLRKELTIRSASGETYKVSYGAEHEVSLGDVWPPQ